ncbi:capsule assembly Wzi family protein [Fodinibius sp. SL11]|uniref:capsule assembly Wzi family protein n=1 Tax=Fodinibius sp. SL11 TaxID=3425690 RepID=UPI003F881864
MRSFSTVSISIVICGLLLLGLRHTASAQTTAPPKEVTVDLEVGTTISGEGTLPFWLHSNRWGIIDRRSANGFVRLAPRVDLGTLGPVKLNAGAELVGRWSEQSSVFFNEGYLQADWKIFRLVAGRKKEQIGITDSSLTSGSMIQSGNASPIPKVRLYTPDFVGVPGTNNWLSFKGYFSHGWMEDGRVSSNAYLHQKNFYLRFFREQSWFNAYGGFTHNVTWAGTHPNYGNLPDGFKNFTRVVLAKNIDEDDPNFPSNETGGTLGNTTAGYDTGIEMSFDFADIMLHRLFYLEDRPGLWFRSPLDGLWGLSVDLKGFPLIEKISWEHLNTTKQGSKSFERRGADNYYSNGIYYSGWTYQNRTIGSPFLFTRPNTVGVQNNIVVMHHFGVEGNISEDINYKFLGSYSRNYGAKRIITNPETLQGQNGRFDRQDQYSFLLQLSIPVRPKLSLNLDLAYDTGELYADQLGGMVSVKYSIK